LSRIPMRSFKFDLDLSLIETGIQKEVLKVLFLKSSWFKFWFEFKNPFFQNAKISILKRIKNLALILFGLSFVLNLKPWPQNPNFRFFFEKIQTLLWISEIF
jgi:hypothetical protein